MVLSCSICNLVAALTGVVLFATLTVPCTGLAIWLLLELDPDDGCCGTLVLLLLLLGVVGLGTGPPELFDFP